MNTLATIFLVYLDGIEDKNSAAASRKIKETW